MLKIYQSYEGRLITPISYILNFNTVLQIVHHLLIALLQCTLVDMGNKAVCFRKYLITHFRVLLAQSLFQVIHMPRFAEVSFHVVATLILVAHLFE